MNRKRFLGLLLVSAVLSAAAFASAPAEPPDKHIPGIADNLQQASSDHNHRLHTIIQDAHNRIPGALGKYCDMLRAIGSSAIPAAMLEATLDLSPREQTIRDHLAALAPLVLTADSYADEALAVQQYDKRFFHNLVVKALESDHDYHSLAAEAVELIARAWNRADALVKTRDDMLKKYQDELRRGEVRDGTRLAWSLIRIAASHPDTRIKAETFKYGDDFAELNLSHLGSDIHIRLNGEDYRTRFRATVDGYAFRSGWAVLFQKPLGWMTSVSKAMAAADVSPEYSDEWEVMEAPEGLIALAVPPDAPRFSVPIHAFYRGAIRDVEALPANENAGCMFDDFQAAAKALHEGIRDDATIPAQLRAALNPILMGTYLPVDSRDYFDSDFCRRLIEADYLEAHINPLPPERREELARYRETLARIEAGVDRFVVDLGEEGRLVAVSRPKIDARAEDDADIRDPDTGETLSSYQWRWESDTDTLFHSPLPGRGFYAMSVLERYPGSHAARPKGTATATEVWHAMLGKVAEYETGAAKAKGDAAKWLEAATLDVRGRRDSTSGPIGWNFPLFVPIRDEQGDPLLIATQNGTLESPDFRGVADAAERREAQDAWLDKAAEVLREPGELALIYTVFFRYCSDSPLPEVPNLIGSHYGLSDTHQTVYQSLDRRWVGRLIGDCDDLAEFFQALAFRQGKLAYVMQVPAHAAAGWLNETANGEYEFIVLQTGPVLRFTDPTRIGAVEKAYRHFEKETGASRFTAAAVPLLLRFANEETRTPFVLPARIYWDSEYAKEMIRVQGYWHLHAYSAGVAAMEEMLSRDRAVGNLKELASLYSRMSEYEKAETLRMEELTAAGDDIQAALSARLEIAQLHVREKNKSKAMRALSTMEEIFRGMRETRSADYRRVASFRLGWATLLTRLDEPERAWDLLRLDVEEADGKLSEPMLRTLVGVYDRMAARRDSATGAAASCPDTERSDSLQATLKRAFGNGYFKKDDSFNKIGSRYFWLGRYGVAAVGRAAGLDLLCQDAPYPDGERAHAERDTNLNEADWEWLRVMPRLYLAYGLEMLDKEEHPELYDPIAAKRCLERVERALERGTALGFNAAGRDAEVKSELLLSFLNRDPEAFVAVMTRVRDMNYSSLYDDAAMTFGMYCGLVPLSDFAHWIDAFRQFFPGRQHYFKAAYRAMDKGHLDHADMLAEATAGYFPDDGLMVGEAAALREATERLRRVQRDGHDDDASATRRDAPQTEIVL